jgi:hypothetical protein
MCTLVTYCGICENLRSVAINVSMYCLGVDSVECDNGADDV